MLYQPALSHQIKQLEDELGTKLVERTNRRCLADSGRRGISRSRDPNFRAGLIRRLEKRLGRSGRGRVAGDRCCQHRGMQHSAGTTAQFPTRVPNIAIDIREMEPGEQVEALRKETIDIGLLFLSIQDPTLDSALVSRERLIVALPTGHRAASAGKVRLRDLESETFLIPRQQPVPGFHELVLNTPEQAECLLLACSRLDCFRPRCFSWQDNSESPWCRSRFNST